jgi:hypothetical protein
MINLKMQRFENLKIDVPLAVKQDCKIIFTT